MNEDKVMVALPPQGPGGVATTSVWYVSARKSVLEAMGDQGIVKWMKLYTQAGVVGVRPFQPKFVEATRILEDAATDFLVDQITLDESLKQAQDRLAQLEV